jgi:hypothetical protein
LKKKIIVILFSFMTISSSYAKFKASNCYYRHLLEAINTNKSRFKDYARLTRGKSRKVHLKLLSGEILGLAIAKWFDFKAKKYQKEGMTIICDELISKRSVPEFYEYTPPTDIYAKFISSNGKKISKDLLKAVRAMDFDRVADIAGRKLMELRSRPSHNCLVRNDLTTIYKAARYAKKHDNQARSLGLKSTLNISQKLIESVILILGTADDVDRQVFPMQKNSVAIICQDFPETRPL